MFWGKFLLNVAVQAKYKRADNILRKAQGDNNIEQEFEPYYG